MSANNFLNHPDCSAESIAQAALAISQDVLQLEESTQGSSTVEFTHDGKIRSVTI